MIKVLSTLVSNDQNCQNNQYFHFLTSTTAIKLPIFEVFASEVSSHQSILGHHSYKPDRNIHDVYTYTSVYSAHEYVQEAICYHD